MLNRRSKRYPLRARSRFAGGLVASLMASACNGQGDGARSAALDSDASANASHVVISVAHRTPRPQNWSVDYWMWLPSGGDPVDGTQAQVQALEPAVMRVGGYNSDANSPDPFDDAQLDKAVAYARAVGAEPLLQVPLIADVDGKTPTAAEAAAMVTYANVTRGYGIKYFAIGNEPDLYASQGALTDASQPAFAGYTPEDYCASVNAFSAAMRAVDPTIQIIGPQLSYKYEAGDDWLTPILAGCGAAFDIVSVQRFPFNAAQATVSRVASDASALRRTVASIRALMDAAGYGDKPLAITGMNVAGSPLPPPPIPDAAQGTVGSALWTADVVGTAQELNLWTTVAWATCDTDDASFGLIGMPPMHTPRPEYYAYSLYAEHFGPTLVDVTQQPQGVSAHATRDQADDATDVIVINWNAAPVPLAFDVVGLSTSPAAPLYQLPALAMAAVELKDDGAASAWVYGDAQFAAGTGPQTLPQGFAVGPDEEAGDGDAGPIEATTLQCATQSLPNAAITTMGRTSSMGPAFGSGSEMWGSFAYAGSGEPVPTMTVAADGNGFVFSGQIVASPMNSYEGVGLFLNSAYCADVSTYTGVRFDVSGRLGGCTLAFGESAAGDLSTTDDPSRGECSLGSAGCYGPSVDITAQISTEDAAGTDPTLADTGIPELSVMTVQVPFVAEQGGAPVSAVDPTTLVSLQWQIAIPSGGCSADVTIANVSFY